MRPEPAFARSLVAWGNAILAGRVAPDAFDAWCSSFRFVGRVAFVDGERRTSPVAPWLLALRDGGVARLALDPGDTPGFELVVACSERPMSAWRQRWIRREGVKEAPWFDADFTREPPPAGAPAEGRAVLAVLGDLVAAASGLVALAARADLGGWGHHFESVVAAARGEGVDRASPLPPSAPEPARRLAHAANLADVFGGMGSWNDFAPLDAPDLEDERTRHSSALYDAVGDALVATAHA